MRNPLQRGRAQPVGQVLFQQQAITSSQEASAIDLFTHVQRGGQRCVQLGDVALLAGFPGLVPRPGKAFGLCIADACGLRLDQIFNVPVVTQTFGLARPLLLIWLDQPFDQVFALRWILQALAQFGVQVCQAIERLKPMSEAAQQHPAYRFMMLQRPPFGAGFGDDHVPR
ncbi:hypothetical protein D3C81_1267820 [compost metagenome]